MATKQQQIDFVNRIAPIIKRVGNERGYKIVSVFIAMACKEGGFGESKLAKNYHNHFGMKAGSSWNGGVVNLKTMEEYTVGKLTQITDGFRTYANDEEGVKGFFDFISTKRYANVKNQTTPLGIITELKKAGYMTSSTYVDSIMNDYIPRYDLTKYDSVTSVTNDNGSTSTNKVNYPTLKLGVTDKQLGGKFVESWQNYLITLGLYSGKADGIFGTKTHFGVRAYQELKGLKVDGIVGKATWSTIPSNEG